MFGLPPAGLVDISDRRERAVTRPGHGACQIQSAEKKLVVSKQLPNL